MTVDNEEQTPELSGPESGDDVEASADDVEAAGGTKASRLDEEGDVAADYLEELLDIADIDGDIDIEVRNGRTYISIVSEDKSDAGLSSLVGRDGEVLEALQELTRLSVLTATDSRSRLVLDVDGYRNQRGGELARIAQDAVDKVKETGDDVALPPMSAYERKIVHDVVADLGLVSESEGEGQARHIVVSPSDD
ncbi:Jag family protein [Arthrobacter sp. TmT3-37]|uniref:RNA-binding protein n=1 Tax=Arthrobacter agilis TaxID=37921 RepID=A0A2L0UAF5_9MICC|nr:R3H domain-containing nucleic acid-binding protein [Arthrobacter agilis]AUZ86219.1 RNA-binding protein [Arthrobacter agilis]